MKMNLHTHTPRCHHAIGSEREYIERAIAAGLDTLGAALTTLQSDIRELQNAYTAYQAGKDAPC